jgi:hypothetical protein
LGKPFKSDTDTYLSATNIVCHGGTEWQIHIYWLYDKCWKVCFCEDVTGAATSKPDLRFEVFTAVKIQVEVILGCDARMFQRSMLPPSSGTQILVAKYVSDSKSPRLCDVLF